MHMTLSGQQQVSIVAGVCLFGLVVVLKNVLQVPGDILSRDLLIYIVVYWAFTLLPPVKGEAEKKSRFDNPLLWSVLIVLITLAIILVYAL